MLPTIITGVILLASVFLVFVVYIQNPKGGGLSSDFGSAQQIGGVQKTNDFIDKTTWGLAAVIGVLSIVLTVTTMSDKPEPIVKEKQEQGQGGQQGQGQGQQGQGQGQQGQGQQR
ncbi:MAG: preprotein translocase subunit SecG [Fluviicola sp. XM-24bin1]|nr:MAG: preprotein translocase subunit SecG [Fluviicola sp. XM-24bin1]